MIINTEDIKKHTQWLPDETQITLRDMRQIIDLMPEVLVRCGKCRWNNEGLCVFWNRYTVDSGYCHKGEA